MAVCKYCGKEMYDNCSCLPRVKIDGKYYNRIKYGDEVWTETTDIPFRQTFKVTMRSYLNKTPEGDYEPCGDCGCKVGEYHHFGCDIEKNPKYGEMGKQMLLCVLSGENIQPTE